MGIMGFILAIRSRRSPILVRMITNVYVIRLFMQRKHNIKSDLRSDEYHLSGSENKAC